MSLSAYRSVPMRERVVKPIEINAFAALGQCLRQIRGHMEAVVPALSALRDVGARGLAR